MAKTKATKSEYLTKELCCAMDAAIDASQELADRANALESSNADRKKQGYELVRANTCLRNEIDELNKQLARLKAKVAKLEAQLKTLRSLLPEECK